jgi:methionyl-tRNA formyltransferase
MKIVFFGTPDFAVPSLQKVLTHPQMQVLAVVTQPDTRRARGTALQFSPIKALATEYQLPIYQPEKLKRDSDTLSALTAMSADFFVVVAYGQILSPHILAMPKFACINVHGSLLPKYRGSAPIQWSIVNGETQTGVTTMLMDAGIDTGAMLLKAETPILPTDQAQSLSARLAHLGADLLVQTLENFHQIKPIPQDDVQSTYAPMIRKEDWELILSQPALHLHNRVRGFYPNCWLNFRGDRLKILGTEPVPATSSAPIGTITQIMKNQGFVIQTGDGGLLIKQLQPPNKKTQSGWDFVNGARLNQGESVVVSPCP